MKVTFTVLLLNILCINAGCKGPPEQERQSLANIPAATTAPAPAIPTDLTADRKPTIVVVTWRGDTVDYDFQESIADANDNTKWTDWDPEKLRPAPTIPAGQPNEGKYFKHANALPQPMRFRVRGIKDGKEGKWTDWVLSKP